MSHAHNDVFNFILSSDLDHFTQRRGKGIQSLNAEPFKVSKLGNQKVNKALIPAKPLKRVNPLFLTGLKHLQTLNTGLNTALQKISLLLTTQMHVLVANLVHVSVPQIILHGLDGVWPVLLVRVLLSQVFENNLVLEVVIGEPKLFDVQTGNIQGSRVALAPVHLQWVGFSKLVPHCPVSVDHHSHTKLLDYLWRSS